VPAAPSVPKLGVNWAAKLAVASVASTVSSTVNVGAPVALAVIDGPSSSKVSCWPMSTEAELA